MNAFKDVTYRGRKVKVELSSNRGGGGERSFSGGKEGRKKFFNKEKRNFGGEKRSFGGEKRNFKRRDDNRERNNNEGGGERKKKFFKR